MVERALSDLLAQHRRAEIDSASARADEEQTVDTLDVWGDPSAFAEAAGRS